MVVTTRGFSFAPSSDCPLPEQATGRRKKASAIEPTTLAVRGMVARGNHRDLALATLSASLVMWLRSWGCARFAPTQFARPVLCGWVPWSGCLAGTLWSVSKLPEYTVTRGSYDNVKCLRVKKEVLHAGDR